MADTLPSLSNDEIKRYSRHLIMPEVGMDVQRSLKAVRVLFIGSVERYHSRAGAPLLFFASRYGALQEPLDAIGREAA